MARCSRTRDLDVHHIRRDGDNSLSNTEVLCQPCHKATAVFGSPSRSPDPFDEATKQAATASSPL